MAKKSPAIVLPTPTIVDKSIKKFMDDAYIEYGNYVNQKRHMPHIKDGLKPSYRRMIFTGLNYSEKMVKVATLTGECGGKYSPHGTDSLGDVVAELVHAGIFEGQGNHGSKSILKTLNINPAAPRYPEAKLHKTWREVIEPVMQLVPKVMSDLGYLEPVYIPSPIPMSLLFGSLGLGIGIRSNIPVFSFKSMIEAYEQNNPKLLQPNGEMIINRRQSELELLWTTGKGKVSYMFLIDENATSSDGVSKGYMMYGDPRFFQTKLTENLDGNEKKEIQGWIDKGLVIMREENDRKTGKKIFFTVKPKQKVVTLEMLRAELEIIRYNNESFKLAITDGDATQVTPLRDWIGSCYKNYQELVTAVKQNKVIALDLREKAVKASKDVANYILKNPKSDVEEISIALKLDEEVTKEVTRKSISVLMKQDEEKELESINNQRQNLKVLKASDFYQDLMK